MNIIDNIKKRKSCRTYTGEPLSVELVAKIEGFISALQPAFGEKVAIRMINAKQPSGAVKLGTYGVIKNATNFLILTRENGKMADVSAGYMFEEVVLYCTALGLGTCWLGGTINKGDFLKQIQIKENERMTIISPVGYPAEKRSLLDSFKRAGAGSDKRKAFGDLFFDQTFDTPLTEQRAGVYRTPLEMVRLAPSASNKQPWRVIMQGNIFHFYQKPGMFAENDLGIALCHFERACMELGIKGRFAQEKEFLHKNGNTQYIISWISE